MDTIPRGFCLCANKGTIQIAVLCVTDFVMQSRLPFPSLLRICTVDCAIAW